MLLQNPLPANAPQNLCTNAASYCGINGQIYPDRRAMGYPFDRLPRNGAVTLQTFLTPNMGVQDVTIQFTDRTVDNNRGPGPRQVDPQAPPPQPPRRTRPETSSPLQPAGGGKRRPILVPGILNSDLNEILNPRRPKTDIGRISFPKPNRYFWRN